MLLKNYLLTALRLLRSNKLYTLLNVAGLVLGIAVSLIILLFLLHERSFDRFHEKHERIYKISRVNNPADGTDPVRYGSLPPALAPALIRDFPQVEKAVRIATRPRTGIARADAGGESYIEHGMRVTDASFFEVFSFRLLEGDPGTALAEPLTIVLSESMAEKYFGEEDVMGQELVINAGHRATVTGIVEDAPANSSITYDFLLSMPSYHVLVPFGEEPDLNWNSFAFQTFIQAAPGADMQALADRLPQYVRSNSSLAERQGLDVDLAEPLASLYLHTRISQNLLGPSGNSGYLGLFGAIALFILLIASLNYMNLATARSLRRAREVGVRKSAGATRRQLSAQFYSEAVIMVLMALPLSLWLVYVSLPWFESLMQYRMDPALISPLQLGATVFLLLVFIGLVSGSYPAWVLSRFRAAEALKGHLRTGRGGPELQVRRGLILFQFVISTVLIVGAFTVHRQVQFMRGSSFLADTEEILNINLFRFPGEQIQALKGDLETLPAVRNASVSFHVPFQQSSYAGARPSEYTHYYVDQDYLETFELQLVAGRDFSDAFMESDRGASLIVNETAVREAVPEADGPEDAVGRRITLNNREYAIVGVVQDFHYESLRNRIKPLYMELRPDAAAHLSLRVGSDDIRQTLADVSSVWASHTDRGMEYTFMEDAFESLYQPEQRLAGLSGWFTGLSIVIAVLGIFGLSGYMAEQRSRELGIRKVFGASMASLVRLLTSEFAVLIGLALLIAVPIAYAVLQQWLQNYNYSIDLSVWLFLAAGSVPLAAGVGVALLQSFRTARTNPVETLREQ